MSGLLQQSHSGRLVVGISGASGAVYGVQLLSALRKSNIETHLVVSQAAYVTIAQELSIRFEDVKKLASLSYNYRDIGAPISSGSFKTMGMIIAPCSVRTMSDIAYGTTGNLISRAADVTLKERRRLVLMVRETPLHLGHLRTMCQLVEMGAVIMPPLPAFYPHPKSIEDIVDHSIGRALDLFDIDLGLVHRWKGVRDERPRR